MRVHTTNPYSKYPTKDIELSAFLRPCNTGSTQGTVEQLEAECEVQRNTIGNLLALLVEKQIITFEEGMEAAGMHSSYREYTHGHCTLIP